MRNPQEMAPPNERVQRHFPYRTRSGKLILASVDGRSDEMDLTCPAVKAPGKRDARLVD